MTNELSQMCINGVDYELKDSVARQNMISVTDAKVGQTIKIAEVDSEGAPTKWAAADVSGGGGCEVAVDGKALVISNDGDDDFYEEIGTYTFDGEIGAINITNWADGTPIKATKIKATYLAPPKDLVMMNCYVTFEDTSQNIQYNLGASNATQYFWAKLECVKTRQYWRAYKLECKTNTNKSYGGYYGPITETNGSMAEELLVENRPYATGLLIRTISGGNFPADATLRVWGVRA